MILTNFQNHCSASINAVPTLLRQHIFAAGNSLLSHYNVNAMLCSGRFRRSLMLMIPQLVLVMTSAVSSPTYANTPFRDFMPDEDQEGTDTGDPDPNANVLLEFHFQPVADLQIAIWLEDGNGKFITDVFVTQATGKLGIGNRPGIWNFLSSWRAPYGPRVSVLPIWAHRRGRSYPKIIFHDDRNLDSLGFHETTSSEENYFCRPLKPSEHLGILDTLTCPSPQVFRSDKGTFVPGETSVYPPRNELATFDPQKDHEDTKQFAELNDLDLVTGPTPSGLNTERLTLRLRRSELQSETLVAWIEVNLEGDSNSSWTFDRENDHYVDKRLSDYGIPYLGQPAVAYRVELDPSEEKFFKSEHYHGYADWDGRSGTIHPPDDTISSNGGSGSDRLKVFNAFGEQARFGVYSHGWNEDSTGTNDTGGDSDTGENPCSESELPPLEDLQLEAIDFDRVRITFKVPESLPPSSQINVLRAFFQPVPLDRFDPQLAIESMLPPVCREAFEEGCIDFSPGNTVSVEVGSLWGNYTYSFALLYEDICDFKSDLSRQQTTTPKQKFQQIDTFCFVATAAYGGAWMEQVDTLRAFRDTWLKGTPIGADFVRFYYAYGPALAKMIASSDFLRAEARSMLSPIVDLAKLSLPTQSGSDSPAVQD